MTGNEGALAGAISALTTLAAAAASRKETARAGAARPEPLAHSVAPHDVIALERAIPSELDSGTEEELRAMLWAIRNRARKTGLSIYRLATGPSGQFGDIVDAQGIPTGRYFSTRFPPQPSRLPLILDVLQAPEAFDPIAGADEWFEPAEADRELHERLPGATRTADQIRADMRRTGIEYVTSVGRLEFWRS